MKEDNDATFLSTNIRKIQYTVDNKTAPLTEAIIIREELDISARKL